ncbi:GIY-YIG nuclease family protein [Metapseudomonas resinovorans]|uniref:GIY-YIG nuclease family protein n=1 Tax=Metapseudomonas resinovorans TaxID=53412 RepID=UPI003D1EABF8
MRREIESFIREEDGEVIRFTALSGFREQMISDIELVEQLEREVKNGTRKRLTQQEKHRCARAVHAMTHIYFVLAPDYSLIKIGRAKDVRARVSQLQSQSPAPLKLLAYFRAHHDFEFYLHKKLAESRAHGEWFHATGMVLDVVDTALDKGVRGIFNFLEAGCIDRLDISPV